MGEKVSRRLSLDFVREGLSPAWAETAFRAERDLRGFPEPRRSNAKAGRVKPGAAEPHSPRTIPSRTPGGTNRE
jgi:hypothetical protein